MASHVPFLALRPDDQFNSEVKPQDLTSANGVSSVMDTPEAPYIARVPEASRLPWPVRFLLTCVASLGLSALLYSASSQWAGYELGAVSKDVTGDLALGMFFAWRLAGLGGAWSAGYDWQDLAAVSLLSNLPHYFLLYTFYDIDLYACAIPLAIDVAANAIPFMLLRGLIYAHEEGSDANQQVAHDWLVVSSTAAFGSMIYAAVVYGSLQTWLPVHLVTHSSGLRDLTRAHEASHFLLALMLLPVGWATTKFLFTPMVGARGNPGITDPSLRPEKVHFDPENATLSETIAFNLGFGRDGFTKRAEILMKRTGVLVACSVGNTVVRALYTIDGTELFGVLGWASVWGIAAMLTSVAYAWVGNE